MIGSSMKNATYHFFLQNPKTLKYTINPDLYKNKHGVIYMNVFGKLVANSILEKKIIGIEFALSFWKFLFGIPYEFEDLHDEFDDVTFNNYENFGKMSETDLEKIDQTFSAFSQGQEVDLIENGSKIQVLNIFIKPKFI